MECAACGREKRCDRVIVDSFDERVIGGLCHACEREYFGKSLRNDVWNTSDRCLLCSRDRLYHLPRMTISIVETNRLSLEASLDISLEEDPLTPGLCDEHLFETLGPVIPDLELSQTTLTKMQQRR